MLLDRPARFLYRHGINLYGAMCVFCTGYSRLIACAVILALVYLAHLLVTGEGVLSALGIINP